MQYGMSHRPDTPIMNFGPNPLDDGTAKLEPLAVPFGHFLSTLRRHFSIILLIFIAGVGGTAIIVSGMARRYTAEASVLVAPHRTQVSDLQAISADPGDIGTVVRTQIDIFKSPTLAANVVKAMHLTADPEFVPRNSAPIAWIKALLKRVGWRSAPPTREPNYDDAVDAAAAILSGKIGFANETRSGVLTVSVTTHNAELSAAVANELVKEFLDFNQQEKFVAMQRAHDWFHEQMGTLAVQLRSDEMAVEQYREEHRLDEGSPGDSDSGIRTTSIAKRQLDAVAQQLSDVSADRARKEAQLAQAELALQGKIPANVLPQVIGSPLIGQLLAQSEQVAGREARLTTLQGNGNPELIAVQAQVRKLRSNIQREMINVANSLKSEVEAARGDEALLRTRMEQLRQAVSAENAAQVGLRALQTKARATRGIYESFLNRATQLANVAGIQEQDASLVSSARPPLGPSAPRSTRLLAVAAALSVVLGIAIACLIERMKNGFGVPEQLEGTLGLELVALVPNMARKTFRHPRRGRASIFFTASLDRLRGQLRAMADARPKLVMVTSALPKEGKSVFAAGFARNGAAAGWRVLLVDCNFGSVSVADQFGLPRAPGLGDILAGSVLGDINRVVHEPEPGLHVITAGDNAGSRVELLASNRMSELLAAARATYDLVVIDTPPVLPVADALVLARQVDATLMVVRWEKTPRQASQEAVRLLGGSGAKLLGAVMTRIDHRTASMMGGRMSYAFSRLAGMYIARG